MDTYTLFAQVENGVVTGTHACDEISAQSPNENWIDITPVPFGVGFSPITEGWLYDGTNFIEPEEPVITTVAFVELFTPAEFMAIEALLGVDAITTQLYKVAELQGTVDMSSPKVTEIALPNFVTLGVMTQERADEIADSWKNGE